jgi:sterol 14-demethylase
MLNAASSSRLLWFEPLFTWMPWDVDVAFPAAVTGLLLVLGTLYARTVYSSNDDTSKVYQLGGFSIVNAWTFFNKRYDFLRSNFDKTGHELFAFKVLHVSLCLCIRAFHGEFILLLAPSCGNVWGRC